MENVRPRRSKAEREALENIQNEFWGKGRMPARFIGKPGEWKEFSNKMHVIEHAIKHRVIDADELLDKYDLVKYL